MVSLYYVPFSHQMAMHEATTYDVPLVMYYDISNYIRNLKERANTVMYVFASPCLLLIECHVSFWNKPFHCHISLKYMIWRIINKIVTVSCSLMYTCTNLLPRKHLIIESNTGLLWKQNSLVYNIYVHKTSFM
jgi:hypothetical protein